MPRLDSPPLTTIALVRDQVEDWTCYPFSVPVIRHLDEIRLTSRLCFLVGENGCGKSTLIEAMAVHFGLDSQGGSRNFHRVEAEDTDIWPLSAALRLVWRRKPLAGYFLRAESLFNVASYVDEIAGGDPKILAAYGGKSLHEQSHGESFLALLQNRLTRDGFYIFDEPDAALSPQRQLSFLAVLDQLLANPGTQFIIATHSPILLAFPGAQILSLDGKTIREISYRDTDSYKIMSAFVAHPEAFLRHLLPGR